MKNPSLGVTDRFFPSFTFCEFKTHFAWFIRVFFLFLYAFMKEKKYEVKFKLVLFQTYPCQNN